MPAVVNIKPTRNITRAVNYASAHNGKDKAHNNYKMKRVLCASGVNCDPETGLKEMMKLVNRKQFIQDLKPQKGKKIVQGYTLIQSFDKSFDYKNEADVQKVNELGQKLVEKVVKNRMALVYTQADGTHHMLHNHIIVCSLASNLKAMRAKQTRFKTWAKASDEVLQEAGLETLAPVSSKGKTIAKEKLTRAEIAEMDKLSQNKDAKGNLAPKKTRMEEIKEKIEEIEQDPSVIDFDSFVEVAKKHSLDVHTRINKKGVMTGLSYKLLNSNMKRGIRAKRLGSNYMKESLNDVFEANIERRRLAKQREARISTRSPEATETSDLGAVQAANFQFALSEQNRVENKSSISTARTRAIGRTVNSEFRRAVTPSNQGTQDLNRPVELDFFQFTQKFGNNERKHKRFDEYLKQFVKYRHDLATIRDIQLDQQQQASDIIGLATIRLEEKLARSANNKSKDLRRNANERQTAPRLITKYGYTLKREYSDYADMLTNQDMADMEFVLHPQWFVRDQQNPTPTPEPPTIQKQQDIDDDLK